MGLATLKYMTRQKPRSKRKLTASRSQVFLIKCKSFHKTNIKFKYTFVHVLNHPTCTLIMFETLILKGIVLKPSVFDSTQTNTGVNETYQSKIYSRETESLRLRYQQSKCLRTCRLKAISGQMDSQFTTCIRIF